MCESQDITQLDFCFVGLDEEVSSQRKVYSRDELIAGILDVAAPPRET
jgi:hypothetical protein